MRTASIPLALALVLGHLGCDDPHASAADTQVMLAIATVPSDVSCLRITATGPGRIVVRELDVTAGSAVNESFSGLPLGVVRFEAEAFVARCQGVTRSTIPGWVSESAPVSVALGRVASVALTLHRNGRAKVMVDFADEPACTAAGQACLNDTECCSHTCVRELCAAADGGVSDAHMSGN